ncbi:hypothetical protein HPB52_025504 [Rhipicephalus sanguineus]|uniref:Transposase Tc1-like domain-containing protein n=1 Tax=Rhipicephalus sanguineus TaxID=34632 RepID=A0A9D4YRE6_RHISA|nr:hypothetical protein HPB52_025504 [Rhipicephalus sanguineus]
MKQIAGLSAASDTTVKRRLYSAALKSRRAVQKPIVSAAKKERRLVFSLEHEHWTEEWQNVVFTDEWTFTTRWDQRQRVWRPDNCRGRSEPTGARPAPLPRCKLSLSGGATVAVK